jgi:hypothetical protein
MQMDRFYGASTSATIRYLGARKNADGYVLDDTIERELRRRMAVLDALEVAPATVLVTSSGTLRERNNVKRIFHVASVKRRATRGLPPGCESRTLPAQRPARDETPDSRAEGLASILLPILGTGPADGDLRDHATRCFNAAIEYLEALATLL